jgi:hypothetical protein
MDIDLIRACARTIVASGILVIADQLFLFGVDREARDLIGHQDPTLSQQILDVAEAEREPKIEPNRVLDDLGREAITVVAAFLPCSTPTGRTKRPQARNAVTTLSLLQNATRVPS